MSGKNPETETQDQFFYHQGTLVWIQIKCKSLFLFGSYYFVIIYIFSQNYSYIYMNRSIAKTRNQLQRITYKINQLKTKYTGQSYTPNLTNAQNSPNIQSSRNEQRSRQPMINSYQNRPIQPANSNQPTKQPNTSNAHEQIYHKDFKVFRNEMYNYIDKCLLLSKEREHQLVQKLVQSQLSSSRTISKMGQTDKQKQKQKQKEQRIKKLEEETTTCISNIQDIISQCKKNQKTQNERITTLQQRLRKEIKQIKENVKNDEQTTDNLFEKVMKNIETTIDNKLQEINIQNISNTEPEQTKTKIEEFEENFRKMKKISEGLDKQLTKIKQKLSKQQRAKPEAIDEEALMNKIQAQAQKQIKRNINEVNNNINKLLQTLEKNCYDISTLGQQVLSLQNKQPEQKVGQKIKDAICKQVKKLELKNEQIQSKIKQWQTNLEQNTQKNRNQVQNLSQRLNKKIQSSIQTQSTYQKQRIQQIKRQILTKLNQQIQYNKQQILINVQETVFEKINKFNSLDKSKKSPKMDIDQSRVVLKQDIKQIQGNLRDRIKQEVEIMMEKYIWKMNTSKLQNISTPNYNHNSRIKSQQSQLLQKQKDKKVEDLINQKLNQFENDINQTIKLLYEDIQGRVNELLVNSGVLNIQNQMSSLKEGQKMLQNNLQNGLALFQTTSTFKTQSLSSTNTQSQGIQVLRQQVYNDMGNQIDKLSNIMESAIEQMETKVQKLDQNFAYIYDRMSKIEYQNASFKDKLNSTQYKIESSIPITNIITKTPDALNKSPLATQLKKSSSGLLDALGSYSAGGYFFEG